MKKILTYFFVTLGVIFFVILSALAYVWFTDSYGIRSLFTKDEAAETVESGSVGVVDKHPGLSSEQETALEKIGIDPAALPSSITPEMEACFVDKLGSARVAEIKAGASPTPLEAVTTASCYKK